MRGHYTHLIFDADHTLLDYIADEKRAFCALYTKLGMPITDELLSLSRTASETAWTEAGLYNVTDPQIQRRYHELYRTHTEEIFRRIFARFPCGTRTAKDAGLQFLEELKIVGEPLGNALSVFRRLSAKGEGKYFTHIATNGLADIQHKRLEAFAPYAYGIFPSQDLHSVKPLPDFFKGVLSRIGARAEDCLMIGDSLISDMQGAKSVGMDTCLLHKTRCDHSAVDMQIERIEQLLQIL